MDSSSIYTKAKTDRVTDSTQLATIFDFGAIPLADDLMTDETLTTPQHQVPLTLAFCPESFLVQVLEEVDPEVLFCRNYPYFSSVSPRLMRHFEESAKYLIEHHSPGSEGLVIEAACNDGILLQHFAKAGIPVLGIDPAEGPVKAAQAKGLRAINDFFGIEIATRLKEEEGMQADIFLANNVLAHVPDLNGFVEGISILLKPDGMAVIEVPYVIDMVDNLEFDTVFHQHFSYFSLSALNFVFLRHGLFINKVKRVSIHGGTVRIFVEKQENRQASYLELIAEENKRKVTSFEYYQDFAKRINDLKAELMTLLNQLKSEGKTIAGYGAAGKANTLCAYFGIGSEHLECIADLSPHKQGLYFPGNRLPIVSPEELKQKAPHYILILAWNFAEEIMAQNPDFKGKWIIPIPSVVVK